jgi:hypothetical protein
MIHTLHHHRNGSHPDPQAVFLDPPHASVPPQYPSTGDIPGALAWLCVVGLVFAAVGWCWVTFVGWE